MPQLHFEQPGSNEPGFLRRSKRALELQETIQSASSGHIASSIIDELIDFLLDYVTEPTDRAEARELLLDASQDQFNEMLAAITGLNSENPTSPNPS